MISIALRTCIGIALMALFDTAALSDEGRPVAAADIAGKKICWNNGRSATFAANGQYTNDRNQHSTWSIAQGGILHIGNDYTETIVLPDGRLQTHRFSGRHGGDKYGWGTVCN